MSTERKNRKANIVNEYKIIKSFQSYDFFCELQEHFQEGWQPMNNPFCSDRFWVCIVYRSKQS